MPGTAEVHGHEDDHREAVRKAATDYETDAHQPRRWEGLTTEVYTK